MSQDRTFTLDLKNGQQIVLKFSPIEATGNRLWQMFATTEALDTVEQIISSPVEPTSIVNTKPIGKPATKTSKKK
jgi:hypothetical protein